MPRECPKKISVRKDKVELSDGIGERWRCGIGEREGLSDVEMVGDGIGEWWS